MLSVQEIAFCRGYEKLRGLRSRQNCRIVESNTWHPFVFGPEFAYKSLWNRCLRTEKTWQTIESKPGPVCFSWKFSSCSVKSTCAPRHEERKYTYREILSVYWKRSCSITVQKVSTYKQAWDWAGQGDIVTTCSPWHMKFGTLRRTR
jgi:hypothetical protein